MELGLIYSLVEAVKKLLVRCRGEFKLKIDRVERDLLNDRAIGKGSRTPEKRL